MVPQNRADHVERVDLVDFGRALVLCLDVFVCFEKPGVAARAQALAGIACKGLKTSER